MDIKLPMKTIFAPNINVRIFDDRVQQPHLFVYISLCISLCVYLFVYISLCVHVCVSVCLSVCLSLSLLYRTDCVSVAASY